MTPEIANCAGRSQKKSGAATLRAIGTAIVAISLTHALWGAPAQITISPSSLKFGNQALEPRAPRCLSH